MPVFQSGEGNAPSWCEVDDFELISIAGGETHTFKKTSEKEIFIVTSGIPVFINGGYNAKVGEAGYFQVPDNGSDETSIWAWKEDAAMVRLMGHWKDMVTSGVWFLGSADQAPIGTPSEGYERHTSLDNHYHDYDEYWVFLEGEARVISEGKQFDIRAGDCVATGRGWHHDGISMQGDEPLKAIWFAGTPEGQKRIGHLHEGKHGKAEPVLDRV